MAQLFSSTEVTILVSPLLILIAIIFFFIFKHFKLLVSSNSSPPLPPGPFLWSSLGKKPHVTLAKLAQTYGPLMTIKFGTQKMIIGSSKVAAMEILRTHDRVLSGRYVQHVAPAKSKEMNNLSIGFVEECNKDWRATRTTSQSELFTGRSIESQASGREKKAMEMVRFVSEKQGEGLMIRDLAYATVLSMLSNILVSKDIVRFDQECLHANFNRITEELNDIAIARNISDFFPMLGSLDLQGLRKRSMDLFGRLCSFWEETVKERRIEKKSTHQKSTHQDFLDTLIDDGCSDDQINMMLMELIAAGSDTSSSTIEWTMAELIKNPRIMKKVRQELESQIQEGEELKESHLKQLTYLQACVKESLRLHPPGPMLLPHRAIETCQVMNYTIPRDTKVMVNYWAISRDPDYWEDPLVYKPERFLIKNLDYKGNHYEFLPFSSGRRICPGMPMAVKHIPLILAFFIKYFDWSLPEGIDPENIDMSEKYALTVTKENPLVLIPKVKK